MHMRRYVGSAVLALLAFSALGDDRNKPVPTETTPTAQVAESGPRPGQPSLEPRGNENVQITAAVEKPHRDAATLARLAEEKTQKVVHDFRCIFLKRERIDGKLRDEEIIDVAFRDAPTSVYMVWQKNADQARRAIFIDSREYTDNKGNKLVRVEPAGSVARLFVSEARIDVHGSEARAASRRGMDEFGFKALMRLLNDYNDIARKEGVLDFYYEGEGVIDGRPTYVLVRRLPYTGENGKYPDALMRMHIDQEWMIPTAVYSYADKDGKELLGSYVYTQVRLNLKLTDEDFKF